MANAVDKIDRVFVLINQKIVLFFSLYFESNQVFLMLLLLVL